jgi:hypothetical protein
MPDLVSIHLVLKNDVVIFNTRKTMSLSCKIFRISLHLAPVPTVITAPKTEPHARPIGKYRLSSFTERKICFNRQKRYDLLYRTSGVFRLPKLATVRIQLICIGRCSVCKKSHSHNNCSRGYTNPDPCRLWYIFARMLNHLKYSNHSLVTA